MPINARRSGLSRMMHGVITGALLAATGALCNAGEIVIESGRVGYSNVAQAERHSFLRLYISSGNKAWSGQITVTFPQDSTQDASVTVGAATTPGVAVPIEVPILLPANWDRLTINATDGRDRQRWTLRANDFAPDGSSLQPPTIDQSRALLLTLGDLSIARTFPTRPESGSSNFVPFDPLAAAAGGPQWIGGQDAPAPTNQADIDRELDRVEHLEWGAALVERATESLPMHWQAYDSYELVIARESALRAQTPQSRAALMEWVMAGGRLLVQLDEAGQGWRALLPEDAPLQGLNVGDSAKATPSPEVVVAASRVTVSGMTGSPAKLRPNTARTISLDQTGLHNGWRVAWPPEGAAANEGWLAYGPVGFGVVGFLGVDPDSLTMNDAEGTLASARLWRNATKLVAWNGEPRQLDAAASEVWWTSASGPTLPTREALRRTLDDITVVTPLGGGVFAGLLVTMLALALALGPGDWFVLRRLRIAHRSWLTALVWIGLASGAALLIPTIVRSGKSGYSVMTVDDVRVLGEGRSVGARTGVIGIFAGAPGKFDLPTHEMGSAWRGVSPSSGAVSRVRAFGAFDMVSREVASLGCRGIEADGPGVGQWNFRTVLFSEPCVAASGRVTARVRSDSFGTEVTLLGVPSGAELDGVVLEMGGRFYTVAFEGAAGSEMKSSSVRMVKEEEACMDQMPPTKRSESGVMGGIRRQGLSAQEDGLLTHPVAAAFSLRGPQERGDSARALMGAGSHACVYVRLKGLDIPGVGGDTELRDARYVWLSRIVAPIEGDRR